MTTQNEWTRESVAQWIKDGRLRYSALTGWQIAMEVSASNAEWFSLTEEHATLAESVAKLLSEKSEEPTAKDYERAEVLLAADDYERRRRAVAHALARERGVDRDWLLRLLETDPDVRARVAEIAQTVPHNGAVLVPMRDTQAWRRPQ